MDWNRYEQGAGWTVLSDGRIIAQNRAQKEARLESIEVHGLACGKSGYEYRTPGKPKSMLQLYRDYAPIIEEASVRFDVPMYQILACIGIEATRLPSDRLRFNPRSVREEPGYLSDSRTPNKVSPGLMQTLLSTARGCLSDVPELDEHAALTREDLFVPRYSILLGCAYMRRQIERIELDERGFDPADPILNLVAAYNAGSVRKTTSNRWHLVTYSDHRIDRYMAWNNDAIAMLADLRT